MDYIYHVMNAQKGDISSYEYLVNHFQGMAISYAYSILHDFQFAEDAAQEAFILLLRNIHNVKEPSAFIAWLRRLIFTCCNRILRKQRYETSIYDMDESIADNVNPHQFAEENERSTLIKNALAQLGEGQQEVFLLYYTFGKSYAEIADYLGISKSTVDNRLYEGKKKLKSIMLNTMEEYLGGYIMKKETFTQKVLEGIPLIYVNNPSENYMFDGCMQSLMRHLKEKEEYDFTFFSGVTGDSFAMTFYNDLSTMNADSLSHDFGGDCVNRAFEACGYKYEQILSDEIKKNPEKYLKKIIDSINDGMPVISKGFGTCGLYSLICGYEEDGKYLLGIIQSEISEPTKYGYAKFANGLDASDELIFIGEKTFTPSMSENMKKAILNIPYLTNMPSTEKLSFAKQELVKLSFGKQAFNDWADVLSIDELFDTEEKCEKMAWGEFCPWVIIATNFGSAPFTGYARTFLERALTYLPDLKNQIENMLKCYDELNRISIGLNDKSSNFKNKDSRKKRTELIREAAHWYEKAASYIDD